MNAIYTENNKEVKVTTVKPNGVQLTCGTGMLLLRKTDNGWVTSAARGSASEQIAMELVFYKHLNK